MDHDDHDQIQTSGWAEETKPKRRAGRRHGVFIRVRSRHESGFGGDRSNGRGVKLGKVPKTESSSAVREGTLRREWQACAVSEIKGSRRVGVGARVTFWLDREDCAASLPLRTQKKPEPEAPASACR